MTDHFKWTAELAEKLKNYWSAANGNLEVFKTSLAADEELKDLSWDLVKEKLEKLELLRSKEKLSSLFTDDLTQLIKDGALPKEGNFDALYQNFCSKVASGETTPEFLENANTFTKKIEELVWDKRPWERFVKS